MTTRKDVETAVRHPAFSHARQGTGCWRDLVFIYHRNPDSPAGVTLALGADAAIANPILRAVQNTSALGPAER